MLIVWFVTRIMPFKKKLDQIVLYSTSTECFSDYVDADTVAMSMLFNKNVEESVCARQRKCRSDCVSDKDQAFEPVYRC